MHKEYGGPLLTEFQSRILETVGALHRRRDPRTGRMEATPLSSLDTSRPWSKSAIAFSVAWRRYRRIRRRWGRHRRRKNASGRGAGTLHCGPTSTTD
jgi:hypothetical protein